MELKPCQCGKYTPRLTYSGGYPFVECPCGMRTRRTETAEYAVEIWNRRLVDDALREENETLSRQLEELRLASEMSIDGLREQIKRFEDLCYKQHAIIASLQGNCRLEQED